MKRIGLILIAVLALAFTVSWPNNMKVIAQESDTITYSEVRDLGWVTYANSSGSVDVHISDETTWQYDSVSGSLNYSFDLLHEWDINVSTGAILPVNLTVTMPKNATPGEEIPITIGIESMQGEIFFILKGYQYLEAETYLEMILEQNSISIENEFYFLLTVLCQYMQSWNLSLETPIGFFNETIEGVSMHLGDFLLNMYMEYAYENDTEVSGELELSVNVSADVLFDVNIIANTSVIGIVNATGSALDAPATYILEWTKEGVKVIYVQISPNATSEDTLNVSVELQYVVHEFRIRFQNISLEITVNEFEFETEFETEFDTEMQNSSLYENATLAPYYSTIKENVITYLMALLSNYTFTDWIFPFSVTETVPIEGVSALATHDGNVVESVSPYDVTTLGSISTTIEIAESGGGEEEEPSPGEETSEETPSLGIPFSELLKGFDGILIIGSALAAIIVIGYIATRRNNK